MMRVVTVLVLLVLSLPVCAEPYTFRWLFPLTYVSTSHLPVEEFTGTEIDCITYRFWESRVPVEQPCPFPATFVPAPQREFTIDVGYPREGGTLHVKARNVLRDGQKSEWFQIVYEVWWPLPAVTRNLTIREIP